MDRAEVLKVLKGQHSAIDKLMAMLLTKDDQLMRAGIVKRGEEFRPTASGPIWEAAKAGHALIVALEVDTVADLADLILSRRTERVLERMLADGRKLWVYPMMFTTRLAIGPADVDGFDDSWCYETREAAEKAFAEWDPLDPATPEPSGWVRHPTTGRRRPFGDTSEEYVVP